MAKREVHVTITGDASDLVRQLERATEAARRLTREIDRRPSVTVEPRGAGPNLSVDVVTNGWRGSVALPPNSQRYVRADRFRIDGHTYEVLVPPGASAIREQNINYLGRA